MCALCHHSQSLLTLILLLVVLILLYFIWSFERDVLYSARFWIVSSLFATQYALIEKRMNLFGLSINGFFDVGHCIKDYSGVFFTKELLSNVPQTLLSAP